MEPDRVYIEAPTHDSVKQPVSFQHLVFTEKGIRMYPEQLRYAWPTELDLMARIAGLRLRDRFGGWNREPFTPASRIHLSIYERAPEKSPK